MAETLGRKTILVVTEFNMDGGGYRSIAEGLCSGFVDAGYDVKIIGTACDGREHNYPFSIIPSHYPWLPMHIQRIAEAVSPAWILILLDIPKIAAILKNIEEHDEGFCHRFKIAAAFPVESSPIHPEWCDWLQRLLAVRFTFTEFGMVELRLNRVPVHRLRVGVDPFWVEEEPSRFENFSRFVLTVADNQIRKNLPDALVIMRDVIKQDGGLSYVIVTSQGSKDGWDLVRIADRLGFSEDKLLLLDKTVVSKHLLRRLYSSAECFLLTSLAEGIGLPVYEAQACGCPVVVPSHTGVKEACLNGVTIDIGKSVIFPWGDVWYHYLDVNDGVAKVLETVKTKDRTRIQFPDWRTVARDLLRILEMFDAVTRGGVDVEENEA